MPAAIRKRLVSSELTSGSPGDLAQAIATRVVALPGVARLVVGNGIDAATYVPGGKVAGVAVRDDIVVIHVVARLLPVTTVAEAVREVALAALADVGGLHRVDVVIEDVEFNGFGPPS